MPSSFSSTRPEYSLRGFERLFGGMIKRAVRKATLNVCYPSGAQETYGDGKEPTATIRLKDKQAVQAIYSDPALKFAEMYMDGRMGVEAGELDSFLQIVKINGAKKFATAPAAVVTIWRMIERYWRRHIA